MAGIERLCQRALSILSPGANTETSLRNKLHRNIAIMTFKSTNDLAPGYLQEKFILVNLIHHINTRSYDFKKIFVTRSNNRHGMCTFMQRLHGAGNRYELVQTSPVFTQDLVDPVQIGSEMVPLMNVILCGTVPF